MANANAILRDLFIRKAGGRVASPVTPPPVPPACTVRNPARPAASLP